MSSSWRLGSLALAVSLLAAPAADAKRVTRARTFYDVDWTSAGVGGIGIGPASITVTGVNGPVAGAYLYWHGIDAVDNGGDGVYDNETITLDGNVVVGVSLGDATTNCWGDGSSRAFVADVSAYVTGDGTYALSGLASLPGHDANGASLVVLFHDGDPTNDRDLVFFEGNDSNNPHGFPGEDNGWHAVLQGINYTSGTVGAQFHVADGQGFPEDSVTLASADGELTIPDADGLWDGTSVPSAGGSRAGDGQLWDIHSFDLTSIFGTVGAHDLKLDGQAPSSDCLGLVLVVIDLPRGSAPRCGDGLLFYPEECDDGNRVDGDCCSSTCTFEPRGSACTDTADLCATSVCDGAGFCDPERGGGCHVPVAPAAASLLLRDGPRGRKDLLDWQWTTGDSTLADYGDPRDSTGYALCVFDKGTGGFRLVSRLDAAPGGGCGRGACWKSTGTGFRYASKAGALRRLVLSAGLPGRARILAKGRGPGLAPGQPLAPMVVVQLRASTGECWVANYSTPERNTRRAFASQSDSEYR